MITRGDWVIAAVIMNTHFERRMTSAHRKYILIAAATIVLCVTVFCNPLAIAYHQWRMNAEHNAVFGNPTPVGNGLASVDETGVDVDAVLERYFTHRKVLVDYGVLRLLSSKFTNLNSDGTQEQSQARSAFINRMWSRFPGHGHYYLSGDGSFETWIPVADETAWNAFIDDEEITSHKSR